MTDTDDRLRNQLRWAIHALLTAGLGLILVLLTLLAASGHGNGDSETYAILAIWGLFVVYAAGTTILVAWKARTWLHALAVHAACVGSIVLGAALIAASAMLGVRWR